MDTQTAEKLTTLHQEKEYYRRAFLAAEERETHLRSQYEQLQTHTRNLQAQYDAVINAFWWRITAPLRRLVDALRPRNATAPAEAGPSTETKPAEPAFDAIADVPALSGEPLVSILIPNREHTEDLSICLESVFARSSYRNFEIIIAENGSFTNTIFRYYENAQRQWDCVRVIRWDGPFNYAAINNFAAAYARGEYLLLLNNDVEVISPAWLEEMLRLAQREDVGAVGAMLYYPDGSVQHAGMSITAEHPNRHLFRGEAPEGEVTACARYVDAVTGACLLLRRSLWDEVGGLDETFEVAFNDVDLCLRLRKKGYRIAFTPFAELYHNEGRSRGSDETPERMLRFENETKRFRIRWLDN